MAPQGYDGSIRISTKIDEVPFNRGVKNITNSATGALNAVLFRAVQVGVVIRGAASAIVGAVSTMANAMKRLLLGSLLLLAVSLTQVFGSIREAIGDVLKLRGDTVTREVESIKHSFEELKAAVAAAFLPLIVFAIPYIRAALDWLIQLFNRIAMITAAFLGQKEALQVLAGSAQKIADANKKSEKAARGQLAAFDKINVLQKKAPVEETTADLPKVEAQMVPVTDDILSKVQEIKKEIASWFADPSGKLKEIWARIVAWFREHVIQPIVDWWQGTWFGPSITALWENFIGTWEKIIANTGRTIENVKKNILQFFEGVRQFLTGVFTGDWELAWQGIKNIVGAVFGNLWEIVRGALVNILIFLGGWKNTFRIVFGSVLDDLSEKFKGYLADLGARFGSVWENVKKGFQNAFAGMKDFAKDVLNTIIGYINGMVQAAVAGINSIIGSVNTVGAFIPNFSPIAEITAPQIPRLATGAVIPPNSEFLAVLGDQRAGRNIEAPEGLLRQLIREEIGVVQGHFTFEFGGDLGSLVRTLKPRLDKETVRIGPSLIRGGST
jgi:phage-related protein